MIAVIRLAGNDSSHQGRVEVFVNGLWGTVCDDGWDLQDAAVACKQLGFFGAEDAKMNAFFGSGTGIVHMADINCAGNETSLLSCSHRTMINNCDHQNDAGLVCAVTAPGNGLISCSVCHLVLVIMTRKGITITKFASLTG